MLSFAAAENGIDYFFHSLLDTFATLEYCILIPMGGSHLGKLRYGFALMTAPIVPLDSIKYDEWSRGLHGIAWVSKQVNVIAKVDFDFEH